MFQTLLRSALTASVAALCAPLYAQEVPATNTGELSVPAFDPRAPLPPLPEIEDDWGDLTDDINIDAADLETEPVVSELRYSFDLAPIAAHGLDAGFKPLSELYEGRGKPAPSLAELRRRARGDTDLLRRLFRSEGFYDAEVSIEIDPSAKNDMLPVVTMIDPGPLYRISTIEIDVADDKRRALVENRLGLAEGDPLKAETLNTALDQLRLGLPEEGFPFAKVDDPVISLDHETRTASYSLAVGLGPAARFGEIRVEGDPLFSARHISRLARFKSGDPYSSDDIEDLRRALIATGLVSTVSISPERTDESLPDDGEGSATVDIAVSLSPAPQRTLAGQLGFSSTEGFRAEASWQHRNLIRPQGQVTFRGVAGTVEQRVSAVLRRSNWKQRDRTLGATIDFSREDRDAFFARTASVGGFIERETNIIWQKAWVYSVGANLTYSQERDRSLRIAPGFAPLRTFFIAAAPLQLTYDGSDDLLDPTEGFRLASRTSPELSFNDGTFGYLRTQVDGSAYLPLMNNKLVFAGRGRFGTIIGAERARIAPSRRFYAGGGGSVRGYGYQDVGPRDADGNPFGGRSLVEFSAEARYRFGNFGIVPFVDAGQVDTRIYPRFKDLQFGAGIGGRYYTSFGPVRFDVATPLNRRQGDALIAVYVSIGQAF